MKQWLFKLAIGVALALLISGLGEVYIVAIRGVFPLKGVIEIVAGLIIGLPSVVLATYFKNKPAEQYNELKILAESGKVSQSFDSQKPGRK